MISATHRHAAIKIDLGAIAENLKNEKKLLPPDSQLFPVLKANAYGHGAVEVAQVAQEVGVGGFCVALLDEALELRDAGIELPILVLGITDPFFAPIAIKNDISLTVGSLEWLEITAEVMRTKAISEPLKIHLAIDSGMSRLGFIDDEDFALANQYLLENPMFVIEGMFTHFASADSPNTAYFDYQVGRFNHFQNLLSVKPKYIHVANTATSLFHQATKSDAVRFGIGVYGLNPSSNPASPDMNSPYELKPALSLSSELIFCKQIQAGVGVGYGSTYVADEPTYIGTVPIGYADGWQRGMQGFKVKVADEWCEIVGRVCMDQFMVKMKKPHPAGTPVELISKDPAAPNSIKAVADYLGTIHYEVACLLTDRLPRIYSK